MSDSNTICSSVAGLSVSTPSGVGLNSTPMVTSSEGDSAYGRVHPTRAVACIDKLSCVLNYASSFSSLEQLDQISKRSHNGRGRFIKRPNEPWRIWFDITNDDKLVFNLNPSHFRLWSQPLNLLTHYFGDVILDAKITRLDCCVTTPEPFDEVILGVELALLS